MRKTIYRDGSASPVDSPPNQLVSPHRNSHEACEHCNHSPRRESSKMREFPSNDPMVLAITREITEVTLGGTFVCNDTIVAAVAQPNMGLMWTVEMGGWLRLRNGLTGQVEHQQKLKSPQNPTCLFLHEDKIWIGFSQGLVAVFRISDRRHIADCIFHQDGVTSLCEHAGTILSAGNDGRVAVWEQETMGCSSHFTVGSNPVNCVVSSSYGILTSGDHNTACCWLRDPHTPLRIFRGHEQEVLSIVVKGDNMWTGSQDCCTKLWSLATGNCLHSIRAHNGPVHSLLSNEGEDKIWSAAMDGTVKIWDINSGEAVGELPMSYPLGKQKHFTFTVARVEKATIWRVWTCGTDGSVRSWLSQSPQANDDEKIREYKNSIDELRSRISSLMVENDELRNRAPFTEEQLQSFLAVKRMEAEASYHSDKALIVELTSLLEASEHRFRNQMSLFEEEADDRAHVISSAMSHQFFVWSKFIEAVEQDEAKRSIALTKFRQLLQDQEVHFAQSLEVERRQKEITSSIAEELRMTISTLTRERDELHLSTESYRHLEGESSERAAQLVRDLHASEDKIGKLESEADEQRQFAARMCGERDSEISALSAQNRALCDNLAASEQARADIRSEFDVQFTEIENLRSEINLRDRNIAELRQSLDSQQIAFIEFEESVESARRESQLLTDSLKEQYNALDDLLQIRNDELQEMSALKIEMEQQHISVMKNLDGYKLKLDQTTLQRDELHARCVEMEAEVTVKQQESFSSQNYAETVKQGLEKELDMLMEQHAAVVEKSVDLKQKLISNEAALSNEVQLKGETLSKYNETRKLLQELVAVNDNLLNETRMAKNSYHQVELKLSEFQRNSNYMSQLNQELELNAEKLRQQLSVQQQERDSLREEIASCKRTLLVSESTLQAIEEEKARQFSQLKAELKALEDGPEQVKRANLRISEFEDVLNGREIEIAKLQRRIDGCDKDLQDRDVLCGELRSSVHDFNDEVDALNGTVNDLRREAKIKDDHILKEQERCHQLTVKQEKLKDKYLQLEKELLVKSEDGARAIHASDFLVRRQQLFVQIIRELESFLSDNANKMKAFFVKTQSLETNSNTLERAKNDTILQMRQLEVKYDQIHQETEQKMRKLRSQFKEKEFEVESLQVQVHSSEERLTSSNKTIYELREQHKTREAELMQKTISLENANEELRTAANSLVKEMRHSTAETNQLKENVLNLSRETNEQRESEIALHEREKGIIVDTLNERAVKLQHQVDEQQMQLSTFEQEVTGLTSTNASLRNRISVLEQDLSLESQRSQQLAKERMEALTEVDLLNSRVSLADGAEKQLAVVQAQHFDTLNELTAANGAVLSKLREVNAELEEEKSCAAKAVLESESLQRERTKLMAAVDDLNFKLQEKKTQEALASRDSVELETTKNEVLRLKRELDEANRGITAMHDTIRDRHREWKVKYDQSESKANQEKDELERCRRELEALQTGRREDSQKRDTVESLAQERDAATSQLKELRSEYEKRANEVNQLKNKEHEQHAIVQKTQRQLREEMDAEMDKFHRLQKQLQSKVDEQEMEIEGLKSRLNTASRNSEELEGQCNKLKWDLRKLETEKSNEIDAIRREVSRKDNEAKSSNQELVDAQHQIASLKQSAIDLQARLDAAEKQLSTAKENLQLEKSQNAEKIQRLEKETQRVDISLQECEKQKQTVEKRYAEKENELQVQKTANSLLKDDIGHKQEQLSEAQGKMRELQRQHDGSLNAEKEYLSKISNLQNELSASRNEIDEKQRKLQQLEGRMQLLTKERDDIGLEFRRCREELDQLRGASDQLASVKENLRNAKLEIETLSKKLEGASHEVHALRLKNEELQHGLEKQRGETVSAQLAVESESAAARQLQLTVEDLNVELSRLKGAVKNDSNEISSLRRQLDGSVERERSRAQNSLTDASHWTQEKKEIQATLSKVKSENSYLQREVTENRRVIRSLESELLAVPTTGNSSQSNLGQDAVDSITNAMGMLTVGDVNQAHAVLQETVDSLKSRAST